MEKIEVDLNLCKACEFCITFCPKDVLALGTTANKMGYVTVVPVAEENCIGCRQCGIVCPEGAISIYK